MKLPLYGWLAAETISLVGTRISMLALPWFVLETTGSPTKAGLIALFELTPLVLSKISAARSSTASAHAASRSPATSARPS